MYYIQPISISLNELWCFHWLQGRVALVLARLAKASAPYSSAFEERCLNCFCAHVFMQYHAIWHRVVRRKDFDMTCSMHFGRLTNIYATMSRWGPSAVRIPSRCFPTSRPPEHVLRRHWGFPATLSWTSFEQIPSNWDLLDDLECFFLRLGVCVCVEMLLGSCDLQLKWTI